MTTQARCRLMADELLEILNDSKKFSKSQNFDREYSEWLDRIQAFYNEEVDEETEELFSIDGICSNSVCGNIDDVAELCNKSIEHKTTKYCQSMINILKFYITLFGGKNIDEEEKSKDGSKPKKIFISHSSKDKEVQDQFAMLLENGIGLDEDQYFYQSGDGTGVKISEDINTRIRRELNNNECLFVALFSKNYFKSIPCLMELGACWRMNDNIVGIVIDPQKETFEKSKEAVCGKLLLNYDDLLGSSTRIDELKDLILKHLGVQQNKDNKHLMKYRDKLVATVKGMAEKQDG